MLQCGELHLFSKCKLHPIPIANIDVRWQSRLGFKVLRLISGGGMDDSDQDEYTPRSVVFAEGAEGEGEQRDCRLKRKDTPHYLKNKRINSNDSNESQAAARVAEVLGGVGGAAARAESSLNATYSSSTTSYHSAAGSSETGLPSLASGRFYGHNL